VPGPLRFPLQVVKRVPSAFDGEGWLFEVKHDGFRVLAIKDGGPPRLYTRNGYDISHRHQHITAALAAFPAERFVLDGELVVLDNGGRSNFAKLARGRTGTHYYAFDLLIRGDANLRAKPLEARKAMLANLLQECDEPVRYCDHIVGKGKAFFDAVQKAGLEGMVAKRRDSAYAGVLTNDWLKIKCLRVHDFVIGGWISDNDKQIGALLLGEFIDGALRYVGQVGSPSDWRVMRAVARLVRARATSPFTDTITAPHAKFCEPAFRASIEFLDFTDDGYLRHPVFRRFADELFSKI
jgi:bifunctional non-homologous end joining protein LigD